MRVYNTMTRSKEELVPLVPGEIRMYSCGVTVYDLSHVGHARMLIVFDVISRYLRFAGYRVTFVRNFTDIEDKIIRRANHEGVPAREISERYVAAFHEDVAALGALPPEVEPKATDHVPEMVALIEKLLARYRLHTGFVNLGKEKMSKSLGNTLTIRDIVKRHEAEALRLWILGTHYRHLLEWSEERVEEAARALARLSRLLDDAAALGGTPGALPPAFAGFAARFSAAMDDDFNTPQALGVLFDFARALSDHRDRGLGTAEARAAFAAGVAELVRLARVLGLLQRGVASGGPPADVARLVAERTAARAARDWKRSDELRAEIQRLGWAVEDTPGGPRLTRSGG